MVLAATDRDTAEWSAESLGRAEVESLSEGVSYDTPRDGVTLSARRDLRSLVLPAEVARLENPAGYVKFPGAWPVARIRLKYTARPKVAERFLARVEGDNGSGVRNNRPADAVVQDAVAKAADVVSAEGLVRDGVNGVRSEIDVVDGRMVRAGKQKAVIATFRHDTSRNLDPQLHTHAVIANMVQGEDGKWRTMANEKLYASKMLIGALYRAELARGLEALGYRVEKTHADGRFEIAGVPRPVIEAFSTRRARSRRRWRRRASAIRRPIPTWQPAPPW